MLHSLLVPIFVRRARCDEILARHGLSPSVAQQDSVDIRCDRFRELARDLATHVRDPHFGFHAALDMPRGAYGVMEYVARNVPTVRAIIEQFVRFSRLVNAMTDVRFENGRLEERIAGEPAGLGPHGNEFALAHQVKVVREAAGVPVLVDRVFFAHAREGDDTELARFFGTRSIEYRAGFNGAALSERTLSTPIERADPRLFHVLEEQARARVTAIVPADDILALVHRAIVGSLEEAEPTAKRIARALGMSERTLHRRLDREGASFRGIVDGIRHKLALEYLRDRRSMFDVAVLLGYSDGRSFARAFRRWTGKTPRAWRSTTWSTSP